MIHDRCHRSRHGAKSLDAWLDAEQCEIWREVIGINKSAHETCQRDALITVRAIYPICYK